MAEDNRTRNTPSARGGRFRTGGEDRQPSLQRGCFAHSAAGCACCQNDKLRQNGILRDERSGYTPWRGTDNAAIVLER